MSCLSAATPLVFLFLSLSANAATVVSPGKKAVLVTGASTGIGPKVTERLAADGYFVYAGARKDTDLAELGKLENVQPVVTITKAGRGLYGLINNAGIGTAGPVVDGSKEEFDSTMLINAEGPWRVTKAFAPLIIAAKGRIATTGSISLRRTDRPPHGAAAAPASFICLGAE